jgi:transcriptional regulator with XRE-family HTH domain
MRSDDEVATDHAGMRLGARLRRIRGQQGLSLQDVEAASGGSIKASVLGAYERGERGLSLPRLRELADFYRIPVQELLPSDEPQEQPPPEQLKVVLDLVELERHRDELPTLASYVDGIRTLRGDYYGRMLTVRHDDLRALAAADGTTPEHLRARLQAARLAR